METMKQKLVASITQRLNDEISPRNPVKFIKGMDVADLVDAGTIVLYTFTRGGRSSASKRQVLMSEVVCAIGHGIRNRNKMKKDSPLAARAGAFILYSFEQLGIIETKMGRAENKHGTFIVDVLQEETLSNLFNEIDIKKIEKLPSLEPYAPWTSTKHETGASMVKTANKEVLSELTPETHPMVFECLNKAQRTGWTVNKDIYNIFTWALRNKTDAFAEIWDMQNPEAKSSKIREANAVGAIAKRFLNDTFYHLYYYDFRGRKYPATAYFHEQGTDASKGLLLRSDSKPIGKTGFEWLLISIASNWAGSAGREDGAKTDKIPLHDRVLWSLDNKEILLSYAENPKVNQGWMKADKPWQFLAACNEWFKAEIWTYEEGVRNGIDPGAETEDSYRSRLYLYRSHLECYIDGSNNGSQHLSALTLDEVTAPHVNLVPSDLPGDLYKYVADHVWTKINQEASNLDPKVKREHESLIDTITDYKNQILQAPMNSDRRKQLIADIKKFKDPRKDLIKEAALVFWARVTDNKHRRKVVKRNVMTLPYGGTAYGLGQQQIDDARKHGIESLNTMEHAWGSYMGREVFDDCKQSLKKPMRLLSVFEAAGEKAGQEGRFLKWYAPITNFPVVQHYVEGVTKKIHVQYGPQVGERSPTTGYHSNDRQLHICVLEESRPSPSKQATGASPNAIHSLDAAHLTLCVNRCNFDVTTIHDSFGCLLADMADLYRIVRESFVELYRTKPLEKLMNDIGGDISQVEIGNLDLNLILESEYCFA